VNDWKIKVKKELVFFIKSFNHTSINSEEGRMLSMASTKMRNLKIDADFSSDTRRNDSNN